MLCAVALALHLWRRPARQDDRAVERVAQGLAQPRAVGGGEPVAHRCGEPAHQAAVRRATLEQGADDRVDPPRRFLDDQLRMAVAGVALAFGLRRGTPRPY